MVHRMLTNQGVFTYVISIGGNCSGTVSFELAYDIILDCSLIPQNFQNLQNLTLDQTCNVGTLSENLITLVPIPHILNAPAISVAGNNGQTSNMEFAYQNNGSAAIDIVFSFEDLYKSICGANSAYTINNIMYGIGTSPVYTDILLPGLTNMETIPFGQTLYIRQNITVNKCYTNCPNDRKVKFTWQCGNNLQNFQFCEECQQEYITQFTFNTEIPSFTVERMLPLVDDVNFNTQCFSTEREWKVKVTNTSLYTTLPSIKLQLNNAAYGIAGLTVIYENSIVQDATTCNTCSFTVTPSVDNPNSACYNDALLGNSYGSYDIDITGGIKANEHVILKFKTYKCCNPNTGFGPKGFNQWTVLSKAKTICNTFLNPTPLPGNVNLALSAAGNVSTHYDSGTDLDLSVGFTPSYPLDFTVETTSGLNYSLFVSSQVMDFSGMFGDSYDKQMFGYTATNPNTSGLIKAQIHCELGLVVCQENDISLQYTSSTTGLQVTVPMLGYYSTNGSNISSTSNPIGCPDCEVADYNFYYSLSDIENGNPSNIDDFFATAQFYFNLTPCCAAEAVTDYNVTFSILANSDCFDYTLPTASSDLTCSDNTVTAGNGCCWLPLSGAGYHINVHCPGCRAPGIIVDDYRIQRNSFGFPDAGNDRVADNTNQLTLVTLPAYETSIYPETLNKHFSVYGDELIDRLTSHLEPGNGALVPPSGNCANSYRGYTYTTSAPPCNSSSDMNGSGINLDILQLHRVIDNSKASDFDIKVLSADLYFDYSCPNCSECEECEKFDFVQATSVDDWSTKFKMTISGNILNSINNPFLERIDNDFMFSFHEDDIKTPPSGVIITSYNNGTNNNFDFLENQQYRLVVRYQICGNKYSTSLYYANNDDLKFLTEITNKMWLTGGSSTGLYPNGFTLANQASHDQMPNIVHDVSVNPQPDMQDDDWALSNNPSYCPTCVQINQSFADDYKFYCETCGGTHTFFSTDVTTTGSYVNENTTSCEKSLTITATNAFARSKFGTGLIPKDLFPFEFRPPGLFPQTWDLIIPPGYAQIGNATIWSNYISPNNPNWTSVSYFKTIPSNAIIPLNFSQSHLATQISGLSCISGLNIPADASSSNLLIGDNLSSQSIKLNFNPSCVVDGGPLLIPANYANIVFEENNTNCSGVSTNCNYDESIDNMHGPNYWFHPNPNLVVDYSPSNVNAFTQEVCWPFTITNFPANPPNSTDPAYTNAYNIFIAIPTGAQYLNGWYANYTYSGSSYSSSSSVNGIIGLWPNGPASNFPIDQNSIISGNVCANYVTCQGVPANNYVTNLTLNTGWNCDGFPTTLSNACNQNYIGSNITVTDLPVNLTVFNSSLTYPPSMELCSSNPSIISAEFTNVDFGTATLPAEIHLLGLNFNILSVSIFNCNTNVSTLLTGGGSNYTITQQNLDDIGWSDYVIGLNECLGVMVEFTADCPDNGGFLLEMPIIELELTSYCGSSVSTTANFPPVPITSSACSNCFGITKTYSPQPAIAGQPVTYTINVYSLNATLPPPVTIDDIFPPSSFFTIAPAVAFPMTITFPQPISSVPITVTGIFNNLNDICPEPNFLNTAYILPAGPTAEICAIVTCPNPEPDDFEVTISDFLASLVFGSSPPSGSLIFVEDYAYLEIDISMTFSNCTFIMGTGSSIVVNPGVNLTLNNNTLVYSCPRMWQGITLRTGSQIQMNDSQLKDADRGIYAEINSAFRVLNSQFLDCVSGIYTQNAGTPTNTVGYVAGTKFGLENLILKGSYNLQIPYGIRGRAGMVLNNLAFMSVGDNNEAENLFENINFGIEIHNSNITSTNCRFENIIPDNEYLNIGVLKPLGCAITARQNIDGIYQLYTLPLANTAITTITNATVGIYTNLYNARINGISMDNVVRGQVSEFSRRRSVQVTNCEINATYRGIDWHYNDQANIMQASNNTIVVDLPAGISGKGSACISMNELSSINDANYLITSNYHLETKSAGHGILTQNVHFASIGDNYVFTNPGNNLSAGTNGITLNSGGDNTVNCNFVINTIPHSNTNTKGMAVSLSVNNNIECNSFKGGIFSTPTGSSIGMFFGGTCAGTIMRANLMENNFEGLYINNTGSIGTQGSGTAHHGNIWINYQFVDGATNANYGNELGSIFRAQTGMGSQMSSIPQYFPHINFANQAAGWFQISAGTPATCQSLQLCIPSSPPGEEHNLEMMIAEESLVTWIYPSETKVINEQYLYHRLTEDSVLLNSDTTYSQFYTSKLNSTIGELHNVRATTQSADNFTSQQLQNLQSAEMLILTKTDSISRLDSLNKIIPQINYTLTRQGLVNSIEILAETIELIMQQHEVNSGSMLDSAAIINSEVLPSVLPEVNKKNINEILIEFKGYGLSTLSNNLSELLSIAHQCPYAGGQAVYQARAMIEMLDESIEYFDDNVCLQSGIFKTQINGGYDAVNYINISPNPANELLTIDIVGPWEGLCYIALLNMMGESIMEDQVSCDQKSKTINIINLSSGIYTVRVYNNNVIKTKKLVIQR